MKTGKRRKGYNPKVIWKEHYGVDLEYEKMVYYYLCGVSKRRDLKKIKNEHLFDRYCDWKEYVRLKYKAFNNLDEFYRFLNFKKRSTNSYNEIYSLLCIPIFVFAFSEMILEVSKGYNNIRIQDIINIISSVSDLEVKIIAAAVVIVILASPILFFGGFMLFIVYKAIADHWKNNNEVSFIEDYIEIIKEIIDEKIIS